MVRADRKSQSSWVNQPCRPQNKSSGSATNSTTANTISGPCCTQRFVPGGAPSAPGPAPAVSARETTDSVTNGAQIRSSATAAATHGMTSSSMSLKPVVASKPKTFFAFSVAGTRRCTSCSNGVSETQRNGTSGPFSFFQISSASSRTVVDSFVERLKSSLSASGCSIAVAIPFAEIAAVGVVADLRAVAEDAQRVLALHDLLHEVGDDVAHRELHVAAQHLDLAERTRLADADAVERPHDRERQPVLVVGGLREVLDRELLEPVRRERRRDSRAAGLRTTATTCADSNTIDELT